MASGGEVSNVDLLASLNARDPLVAMQAIRQCAARLRDGRWSLQEAVALTAKLEALASHESPRVRQAVAESIAYLSEAVYARLHALLVKDESPYVREAAMGSERKRAGMRREAATGKEQDARVDRWWGEVEKKGARLATQRIAAHEREYFVRRMCHEAGGTYVGHADAVATLRAAIEQPVIDRAVLRAAVDRVDERFTHLKHVLATGKENAKTIEPAFRTENLLALVADEAALLATHFVDRADRLAIEVSGVDPALAIEADASFLRQAFANILRNAVEAYDEHPPDAAIDIRVSATVADGGRDIVLAFADRGKGMRPEERDGAFVPFGSRKKGGTGFGLFVARWVARSIHGGALSIDSEPGVGTTVTMTLPVRQEMPKARRARKARA